MKAKSIFSAAHLPTTALAAALFSAAALWNGCNQTESTPDDGVLINIQSPKGGDVFKVGDTLTVKWTIKSVENGIQAVDLLISPDGENWIYMKSGGSFYPADPGFGTYKWKIKDTVSSIGVKYALVNCKKCQIRIEDYSHPTDPLKNRTTPVFTINP